MNTVEHQIHPGQVWADNDRRSEGRTAGVLPRLPDVLREGGMSAPRVTIDVDQSRINAHLRAPYSRDLAARMQSRQFRFSRRYGYYSVPMAKVEDLVGELTGAGYDVVVERAA